MKSLRLLVFAACFLVAIDSFAEDKQEGKGRD